MKKRKVGGLPPRSRLKPTGLTSVDPVAAVVTVPLITPEEVRKWVNDVSAKRGRRWPELSDDAIVAVATACNRERKELAIDKQIFLSMEEVRGQIHAARAAADTLLSELPALLRVYQDWPERLSQPIYLRKDLKFLVTAQSIIQKLRPFLDSTRTPGGQRNRHSAFACRLAAHIKHSVEEQGGKASVQPTSPLICLVMKATCAVFGQVTTHDALARVIKRHFGEMQRRI